MSGVLVTISNPSDSSRTYSKPYIGSTDVDSATMDCCLRMLANPPKGWYKEEWPNTMRGAAEKLASDVAIVATIIGEDDVGIIDMWMPTSSFDEVIGRYYENRADPVFLARHHAVIGKLCKMYEGVLHSAH